VLVDLFTQGAHCCSVTLILRWDASAPRYRSRLVFWGNLRHEARRPRPRRLPELSASDERFLYTYTAYVFSYAPPQIYDYQQGKLVDVTRNFPVEIRKNAAYASSSFVHLKKAATGFDPRAFVAVYVADQYLLAGPTSRRRRSTTRSRRGSCTEGKDVPRDACRAAFVAKLNRDLRTWGYIT
jgi:hypothetical protein